MIGFVNGLAIILGMGQIGSFMTVVPATPWSNTTTDNITWVVTNATAATSAFVGWNAFGWMCMHMAVVVATIVGAPLIPKIGKYIPASLTGILLATLLEWVIVRNTGYSTPVIGEVSTVSGGLPQFFWADPQYGKK